MLTILTVSTGWCHGVEGYVEKTLTHCITAMYDDGEPMSYAAVEVKAPESKISFQTGRTDRNGCFVVKTDVPGDWQVVVSDGMGHRLALGFPVSANPENTQMVEKEAVPRAARHSMDRLTKIVAGLSVIFGLCGVAYGWKRRKNAA
jgi:nickel transport protein